MTTAHKELPTGWKWVKLGDVSDVVSGATPKSKVEDYWDGDVCWVTPTDLSNLDGKFINYSGRYISQSGFDSCSTRLVPEGAVVMSSRAPIGHLGIAAKTLCTNQGCKTFVPKDNLDSAFLYYALERFMPKIQSLGTGSTFKEVSKTVLESFSLPIPPLEEQKRIAEILNKAEELKKLREEADRKTEELIPAIFHDMFGDSGSFANGMISDLCREERKQVRPTDIEFGELPYLGLESIASATGEIAVEASEIRQDTVKSNCFYFDDNHVLYGKLRPYLNKVALPTFKGKCSTEIIPILPYKTNREYLAALLRSDRILNIVNSMSYGSRMPRTNMKALFAVPIRIPSVEDQEEFGHRVRKIEDVALGQSKALAKSEHLQSSLIQKAFQGQL